MHAQLSAGPGRGMAALIEADGMVDVPVIESAGSHWHAAAVQMLGNGGAVDPEPGREVLDAGPGPVAIHQRRDLGSREGDDDGPRSTDSGAMITDGGFGELLHPFDPGCPFRIAPQ